MSYLAGSSGLSHIFDRLITERIKKIIWQQNQEADRVAHSNRVIAKLREELAVILKAVMKGEYRCLVEQRTWPQDREIESLLNNLDELITADFDVGHYDREKLALCAAILKCRRANEKRCGARNAIEAHFEAIFPLKGRRKTNGSPRVCRTRQQAVSIQ